jgi:DNA repair protein RadC
MYLLCKKEESPITKAEKETALESFLPIFPYLKHVVMKKKNSKFYKVSEVKISYHNKVKLADSPQITCSKDAADIFYANWSDDMELIESFNILILNRANKVKGIFTVSKGGIAGTVVDAKIIFATALKALASSLILAHNHPSGNRKASKADIEITKETG